MTISCLGRVPTYYPLMIHHHLFHQISIIIFRDEMAAKDYEMEKLREEIRKLQQVVVPASMTQPDLQLC